FFALLCDKIGLRQDLRDAQNDKSRWPMLRQEFARIFVERSRQEWTDLLEGSDACFAPVLPLSEAEQHPHNVERGAIKRIDGIPHPAPAPRFSRTPSAIRRVAPCDAVTTAAVLSDCTP